MAFKPWCCDELLLRIEDASAIFVASFVFPSYVFVLIKAPAMLEGVFSVLPTPFLSDLSVDIHSLRKVIDLYIRAGVNGLTASGVTSETARLSSSERMLVLETVMQHVNGRVPVIIGTSADGLQTCIDLSRAAQSLGAAAVMISPPRLPKLSSVSVLAHFKQVASAVDLPIVAQDYPPVSGFTMEPALLARIVSEIPAVKGIKLEDPPTPLKIARVLELTKSAEIVGGLGGSYLIEELMAGSVGAMTGFAVPELLVKIVGLFRSGKTGEAAELFYQTVALMRFEFQESIGMAIRKEILRRRGAVVRADTRPPGASLDESTRRALESMLNWFRSTYKDLLWTLD